MLDYFGRMEVPGVSWNWQPLAKEKLFRRSIGRNLAAKSTEADWIWFTDADIIFHENCLDTLAELLQGRDDGLVHPRIGLGTALLPEDHEILEKGRTCSKYRSSNSAPTGGRAQKPKVRTRLRTAILLEPAAIAIQSSTTRHLRSAG